MRAPMRLILLWSAIIVVVGFLDRRTSGESATCTIAPLWCILLL
jgi:hypothetical protein